MALNASARRPTSSLRSARTRRDRVAAGDGFGRGGQVEDRRRDAPADDPGEQRAEHDEERADRQHRVPEGVRRPERHRLRRLDPDGQRRVRHPHFGAQPRRPVGALERHDLAGGGGRRRLDALARSVQSPDAREPRRSALPTPIRRPMAWPAVGDAERRRKTRKPRRPASGPSAAPSPRRPARCRAGRPAPAPARRRRRAAARRRVPGGTPGRRGPLVAAACASRSPDALHSSTPMFCGAVASTRLELALRRRDRRRVAGDEPLLQRRMRPRAFRASSTRWASPCDRIRLHWRALVSSRLRAVSSTAWRTSMYDAVPPAPTIATRNSEMISGSRRRSEPPRCADHGTRERAPSRARGSRSTTSRSSGTTANRKAPVATAVAGRRGRRLL